MPELADHILDRLAGLLAGMGPIRARPVGLDMHMDGITGELVVQVEMEGDDLDRLGREIAALLGVDTTDTWRPVLECRFRM
jgi:hypothetical protein